MFGISPLGWVHTLGSLPAIPLASPDIYVCPSLVDRASVPGLALVYFRLMQIGAATVFLVAHQWCAGYWHWRCD